MNKWNVLGLMLLSGVALQAQQLTHADYERAEKMLGPNTQQYIDNVAGSITWLPGEKAWYRKLTPTGSEFILIDATKGTRKPAFDHDKLAAALSTSTSKNFAGAMLPFREIRFSSDGKKLLFDFAKQTYTCDLKSYQLSAEPQHKKAYTAAFDESKSPDGKKVAYIRNYNLYMRDLGTDVETQLTTDGEKDFGYATDNAGWKHSTRPILSWSPDSKKVATFRQDERKVGEMYLVTTNVGHPKLEAWKYPLPGDSVVAMLHRVIIDIDSKTIVPFKIAPDPHRSTLGDDISRAGNLNDAEWSADGKTLAFVSTSRDHKEAKVRIADVQTGDVKEIFTEKVETQFESGQNAISWRYLSASNEIIWYSERDNWGHLYLYDATTGKLKNQITKGDWLVTQVVKVDEKNRQIYFLSNGQDKSNPYYTHFFKIGFDGTNFTPLTTETGVHTVALSPSGAFFTDTYSQPDVAPVLTLRNSNGKLIAQLEKTETGRLTAIGWKAPIPFTTKAADGKSDVYGLVYTPSKLDSSAQYPVVDYIYPGPQGGSVRTWAFNASRRDNQALAELGFIVVELEGTSNPLRSKAFHDMAYGRMADNTLPDQVSAIRQLAGRFRWIDTTRVGIHGHSGGGFATACAMFVFPDFFKVGIAESGNHDNRNYEDDWGERYIGLETKTNGVSNYEWQANQVHAKNLKGKLMLAHGMMDDNVPPYNTLLVVEALEKANKDYDLIIFPNSRHGYGNYNPYMMRRRWDYFIEHLKGVKPPKEYQMKTFSDPRN